MKRRTTNRLLAYLLVLVMMFSTSMTALAEGSSDVSGNDAVITETQPTQEPSVSDNASTDETDLDLSVEESEETALEPEEMLEDSVSDNEIAEEEEELFPGLPEDFKMTASMLDKKRALTDTLNGLDDMIEGREYKEQEVFFSCDTREEAELYAAAYNATLKSYFDGIGVLLLPEDVTVASAVKAAANVESMLPPVSPNYYRYAMDTDEEILSEESYTVSAQAYNDPNLKPTSAAYQWHHQVVGSSYAWNSGYTGAGIKVAVLDNGVAPHEELTIAGNYNAAQENSTTYYDAVIDADADYGNNHGTHVAGIIAAKNNNGKGGSGIAPDAAIYNIKVLGSEDEAGTSATLVRGINKAIAWKVDVINMSLGGAGYADEEADAVNRAYNAGIAVFAAAGNDGSQTISYPAGLPNVICVAATNTNNSRASFSNYGAWVDLAAPGVGIYSTIQGGYGSMDGTSQATPVAAGTAAVLLQAGIKDSNGADLTGAQKVAALEKMMKSNAIKATGGKIGSGITSLPKALKLSTVLTVPNKPVFDQKAGTYETATLDVSISAENGMTIYYSTNGKTPTFKNGVVKDGIKYTGPVTLSGIVNGKATGKMTLKAIAVNAVGKVSKATSATYTFKPAVEKITITGLKEVPAGKSIILSAAVTPTYAKVKKVTWDISPKNAGVSINKKNGKVTASRTATAGTYTVTATANDESGVSAAYTIQVTASARIGSMAFSAKSKTLEKGSSSATFDASALLSVKDLEGNDLAVAGNVSWTSNNAAVATVNTNGVVTAVGAGTAVITATAADGSGKKATIKVTVQMLPTSLTITGSKVLGVGKSITLKATVNPATVKDKAVTWDISPKDTGVSINRKNGKVTASRTATTGNYTVTAETKNGIRNTYTIQVDSAVTSLKLEESKLDLFRVAGNKGAAVLKTVNLKVEGGYNENSFEIANSAPGIVSCTLQDKVLTVKATGKTTGKAVITVKTTDGSKKKAKVTVNVVNPPSNLTISPQAGREGYLGKGKKLTLSGVLETEFGSLSAASKKLKWSSSDTNVATVSAKGVVTAKSAGGYATITAEATDGSNVSATYEIYTFNAIEKLSLGEGYTRYIQDIPMWYEIPIYYNNTDWRNAGVYPEVSVEVSDPKMMSVTTSQTTREYGKLAIIPYQAGSAKITVKALDGSGKSVSLLMSFTEE